LHHPKSARCRNHGKTAVSPQNVAEIDENHSKIDFENFNISTLSTAQKSTVGHIFSAKIDKNHSKFAASNSANTNENS
jgi:GTP-sensing pleiotropic transcriptional regulator CodY